MPLLQAVAQLSRIDEWRHGRPPAQVRADLETDCGRLARSTSFLREGDTVDWVDGRTGVQHFFRHALYRQVLYGRVTPARRQLLHGQRVVRARALPRDRHDGQLAMLPRRDACRPPSDAGARFSRTSGDTRRIVEAPCDFAHVAACGVRVGALLLDDAIVEANVATLVARSTRLSDVWLPWSQIGEGWLELRRGHLQGAARIRDARRKRLETGTRGYQSQFAAMAATGFLEAGRYDEAGALLDDGLTLIADTGECWCEADVHRLKGELALARAGKNVTPQVAEYAEACFQRALEIARAQGAKWWTLRAATSLARLLDRGDRRERALRLLKDTCDAFDEGFDLPDLRAARELLQRLGD